MVRRLFRANETFRGRIRAELIRTPVKAVPPTSIPAVSIASPTPRSKFHLLARQKDPTKILLQYFCRVSVQEALKAAGRAAGVDVTVLCIRNGKVRSVAWEMLCRWRMPARRW